MTERRLRLAALVAFVAGIGLMVPFEHTVTLALGAAFLLAFIVLGVFGLLTPERLAAEPPAERAPAPDAHERERD